MTETLWVRVRAPFAAFRWLQAGVYRASSPTFTPTAAWGLMLNLGAIESRGPLDTAVTGTRDDAPPLCIAVGDLVSAEVATVYQQLHGYPVGNSGKELQALAHGQKYWIAPAKREVLVGLDCIIGARGDASVLERIRRGLRGDLQGERYGIPFAGDNSFFFERLDLVEPVLPARWYTPVVDAGPAPRSARLTVSIDRQDSSRTVTRLFAPGEPMVTPPDAAWQWVPRSPANLTTGRG